MSGGTPLIPTPFRGLSNVPAGNAFVGQDAAQGIGLPLSQPINLAILNATTTDANDSAKITGQTGAFSASNPGYVILPSTVTAGRRVVLAITADVTLKLTGITFGDGGLGDITGGIFRLYAINDNGTLKWGVSRCGGRDFIADTSSTTTQASVSAPETMFVNSALSSGTWPCVEVGYFYADFDDTGGASEDLWTVSTNKNLLRTDRTADGLWQPYNVVQTGTSADQTFLEKRFMMIGKMVYISLVKNADATSNSTSYTFTGPINAKSVQNLLGVQLKNNGAAVLNIGQVLTGAASRVLSMTINMAGANWTGGATLKSASVIGQYEANV